jgi:hypothetical protein
MESFHGYTIYSELDELANHLKTLGRKDEAVEVLKASKFIDPELILEIYNNHAISLCFDEVIVPKIIRYSDCLNLGIECATSNYNPFAVALMQSEYDTTAEAFYAMQAANMLRKRRGYIIFTKGVPDSMRNTKIMMNSSKYGCSHNTIQVLPDISFKALHLIMTDLFSHT